MLHNLYDGTATLNFVPNLLNITHTGDDAWSLFAITGCFLVFNTLGVFYHYFRYKDTCTLKIFVASYTYIYLSGKF